MPLMLCYLTSKLLGEFRILAKRPPARLVKGKRVQVTVTGGQPRRLEDVFTEFGGRLVQRGARRTGVSSMD